MAQKRKVTPKKSNRRKSSRKSSKKQIPLYKLLVYCALAISFLILLYLLSDIIAKSPAGVNNEVQVTSEGLSTAGENKTATGKKTSDGEKKKTAPEKKASAGEKKSSSGKKESTTTARKSSSEAVSEKKAPAAEKKPAAAENKTPAQENTIKTPENKTSASEKVTQAPEKTIKAPEKKAPAQENKTVAQEKKSSSASQTQPPLPDFNFPQAQASAKLVFVFDDGGQNLDHLEKFLALPFPVTVAVLPQIAKSVESAKRVRQSGNELMLHQPMQSVDLKINPGPGAILPSMSEEEIISQLFTNISQIGPVAGFNNHEGSAITADAEKMAVVLRFASEEGIYFLDSRTNVETKVPYVASQMGYGYYERNIFLDNIKTEQNALNELKKGLTIANSNGYVIMIGHIWSADFLPAFLQKVYPELVKKGYKFTTVSQCAIKY